VQHGDRPPRNQETIPYQRLTENPQKIWGATLWTRSLRERGVELEDPMYANMGGNIKDMREEWQRVEEGAQVPYSGSTTSGKAAMTTPPDCKRWVERPVSVGKYALDHMEGMRYQWNAKPRPCLTNIVDAREAIPVRPETSCY
jgi:hypothetical protein